MHVFNESNVLFYFIFYGGALVFLGGAGAPASPSLAPPMALGHTVCVADLERVCCVTAAEKSASLLFCRGAAVAVCLDRAPDTRIFRRQCGCSNPLT